jgi:hypothetical protein
MQDTAQDVAPLNWTIARRALQPNRALLIDALMRSSMVVVLDVSCQHSAKMPFPKDQELVQALLPGRADPTFRESVSIWRSNRGPDNCHIL